MRHNYVLVILSCLLICASCNREDHAPEVDINKYLGSNLIKNITSNSVEFEYKLPSGNTETGVFISTDSSKLVAPTIGGIYTAATFDQQRNHYSVIAESLEPYTKYWYTIQVKSSEGAIKYSKLLSFETGGFNLTWQDGFTKSVKLDQSTYPPLVLIGFNIDTNLQHYRVEFGDLPTYYIYKSEKVEANSNKYYLQILIPWNIPAGKKKFAILYKGKKIFEDEILVEQGNTFNAVKVSEQPQILGADWAYFKYQEKVYILSLNSTRQLSIWDPLTNKWESKSTPDGIGVGRKMKGTEVNGKIYFPPYSKGGFYVGGGYNTGGTYIPYQERIYSYHPATDTWEYDVLSEGDNNVNDMLNPEDTFAYKGKLYAIVFQYRRGSNGGSEKKDLLKVFDPLKKTWEEVMNLGSLNGWGYKAIVAQNRIFIVSSQMKYQSMATTYFKNVMYELDLNSKSLKKRAEISVSDNVSGNIESALFEHGGYIYLYGGKNSIGYNGIGSTDLYRYDFNSDKWTWLRSLAAKLPSFDHFAYNLNGKVYIGFGYRTSHERGKDIYELKFLDL